jgi:hypothetical protein
LAAADLPIYKVQGHTATTWIKEIMTCIESVVNEKAIKALKDSRKEMESLLDENDRKYTAIQKISGILTQPIQD